MTTSATFSVRTVAKSIRDNLEVDDFDFALRMLIIAVNDCRQIIASGDLDVLEEFLKAPRSTGSLRWDTLLGASIGRELRRAGLGRPLWTTPKSLESFWFVNDPPAVLWARIMQRTPPDLACLGIWLDGKSFDIA